MLRYEHVCEKCSVPHLQCSKNVVPLKWLVYIVWLFSEKQNTELFNKIPTFIAVSSKIY